MSDASVRAACDMTMATFFSALRHTVPFDYFFSFLSIALLKRIDEDGSSPIF